MAQIFISYRREDSAGYAGRLSEALERRLGHGAVFRDVDALQPGQDFVDTIAIRLRDARACLVLIGREWLDAKDKSGRRRLEEPNDYVLHEIATALRGPDMLVIPVLVEGTRMPAPDELPESIQALARRHAAALHDESWDGDVDRLVTVVRKATGGGLPFGDVRTWLQRHRLRLAGAVAAALVALLLVQNRNPQPPAQSDTAAPVVPASTSAPDAASAAVVGPDRETDGSWAVARNRSRFTNVREIGTSSGREGSVANAIDGGDESVAHGSGSGGADRQRSRRPSAPRRYSGRSIRCIG